MTQRRNEAISAAVFCPQNKPPEAKYMESIRRYLRGNPLLQPFEQAILDLQNSWDIFARANTDIAALKAGPKYMKDLHDWIAYNVPLPIPEVMSGILALPILTIIQIVQYFQYLDFRGILHAQFLDEIRMGGAQGYCGGLLPAIAIAASQDELEVVRNAAKSLRIAVGIGAYGELGDDEDIPGPSTLVLRAKYAAQASEIVAKFPRAYISAVTDPLSISIVGPVRVLEELKVYAEAEGLAVTKINIRGKVHNPENSELSEELCRLCDEHTELQLPNSDKLFAPIRSNKTSKLVSGVHLGHEVVVSTLVERCEWYTLLGSMANSLRDTGYSSHTFAMFGTGRKNCVPVGPFDENKLEITKLDVMTTLATATSLPRPGLVLGAYPKGAIAIVGVGCRLPGANSIDDLWDLISTGESRVEELPAQRLESKYANRVSLDCRKRNSQQTWYGNFIDGVDEFDNAFFNISPRESMYMDPQQRLLLETAYEALDSSGYLRHHRRENFDKVGCFIGTTYTEYLENTTAYSASGFSATGTIRAFQNGKISYHFGWSGPSEAIDTACSSSLVAIHRACRAIQAGECHMALAGGVNIITGIHNFLDLGTAGFLSKTGQCKPFDQAADGYCRADGVSLVVLKELDQAVAAGDNILGVIPGVATNHGGLSQSITLPYSRAQTSLFKTVLEQSGLKPYHISYVEAHGPGTQGGDPVEMASIRDVFGGSQRNENLYIGSVKGNIGHSETAAGAGSLLKVLAMIQHREIPPMSGFQTLNPKIPALEPDHLVINRQALPWDVSFRVSLVNSYGAAGSNAALICCEAPREARDISIESDLSWPIFLSGATAQSLKANASKLASYIRKVLTSNTTNSLRIGDIAFTLHERRKHHSVQWVGTAQDLSSLVQSLESDNFDSKMIEATSYAKKRKPVVLVFSGQSKQTIQLDVSWYCSFPRLRLYLERCDEILKDLGYSAILPVIFQSEPVSNAVALQCGTFAVQYACAQCWIDSGLEVDAILGHSLGELTAMVTSGVLSLEDGLELVASRASLMLRNWGLERGAMLAIHAMHETVSEIMAIINSDNLGLDGQLEIACFNGPRSQVVVGTEAHIGRTEDLMRQDPRFRGIQHQRVDVTHGFHSVFTEPLLEDLNLVAKRLTFNHPTVTLEACSKLPLDSITHDRVIQHTRMPVYFSEAVTRLEDRLGSCVWLEAGTNSSIIPMTKRAIKEPSSHVFLSVKGKGDSESIANVTAALWREGISTSFWACLLSRGTGPKQVWLPPYQFQRKGHWLDWIDPVTEEQRKVAEQIENQVMSDTARKVVSSRLVTPQYNMTKSWASLEFAIHTDTIRYTDIVSGHAVRGYPLCPASMYMECVVMAAQMLKPKISVNANLKFEQISFLGALGLNKGKHLSLIMENAEEKLTWGFSFSSSAKHISKARSTPHAKGRFSMTYQTDFSLYERIGLDRIQQVLADPRAENFMANRAYALFSRVVNYANILRGISRITILKHEAVAQVSRPLVPVSSVETTAVKKCDTVTIDTFIQVIGLLINSSETCPQSEVFIATSVDSIVMQDCDFQEYDSWTVYTMISSRGELNVAGDMLVFTSGGKLVLTGSGLNFSRLPIVKLKRLLENNSSNGLVKASSTSQDNSALERSTIAIDSGRIQYGGEDSDENILVATDSHSKLSDASQDTDLTLLGLDELTEFKVIGESRVRIGKEVDKQSLTPDSSDYRFDGLKESVQPSPNGDSQIDLVKTSVIRTRQRLLQLISQNCGDPILNLEDDSTLQDIGVDSLSVIDLVSSLEDSFDIQFDDKQWPLQSTITEILGYLVANTAQNLIMV